MSEAAWAAPTCTSFLGVDLTNVSFQSIEGAIFAYSGEKKIGFIRFGYVAEIKAVLIEDIDVKKKYRGNGLSKILLERVLKQFPDTELIDALIAGTNKEIYNAFKAQSSGGRIEAIKKTPAYKIKRDLGFSKIIEFEDAEGFILLIVGKDD